MIHEKELHVLVPSESLFLVTDYEDETKPNTPPDNFGSSYDSRTEYFLKQQILLEESLTIFFRLLDFPQ